MNKQEHKSSNVELKLNLLPNLPGVYQFYDEQGKILYIGKAKNLKKRVSSYFHKEHPSGKLRVLVKKIRDIKHTIVESESDALLLENNLIKKHQPRYNAQLKDDKTFPWICVKKEPFPRVFSTRTYIEDGSRYFGPYTSVRMMNTLLQLIRQIYPLRTCKYQLSQRNIEQKKFKVCLEYHIGKCLAPCVGKQNEENYNAIVEEVVHILKGNIHTVLHTLKKMMDTYARQLEFEKAQAVKEKLEILKRFQSKSTIVNINISNVDVFSVVSDHKSAYVNYLKLVKGAIVQTHNLEISKKLDETDEEVLTRAITEIRQRFDSQSKEIILPLKPDYQLEGIRYIIPKIGDKKQLLELSARNAKTFRLEKEKRKELVDPERHTRRIMQTMKEDLRMKAEPRRIECFDNSNFQGDYAVAAMSCFINGKPAKKEYRHFNIKTVSGPDDFASMQEVIFRRYKRLLSEKKDLPQLIVIDGGKGQLSAAVESLDKLELKGKITIIGIAKKLEEIYFPGDSIPLYIDKKSETLKILQQLRDEAHRFGITHHRKKFEKGTIKTTLTEIEGIGFKTAQKLLWKFKSVKRISLANQEELSSVIGTAKAKVIYRYFHSDNH